MLTQAKTQLSEQSFAITLGSFVVLGLGSTALATYLAQSMPFNWVVWVACLILSIVGIFVNRSQNLITSLFGFGLTAIASGVMIAPTIAIYPKAPVFEIMCITLGVSAILSLAGALMPKMRDYGRYIVGALAVLLICGLGLMIFPATQALLNLWSAIAVLLFSGLIVYDVNQAMNDEELSAVSASQHALGIYLDIFNLFLNLLRLMGGNSSD